MRVWQKYMVLTLWLGLLLGAWFYVRDQGQTPTALLRAAIGSLREQPLAPLYLLGIYLLRPLFLLPISLLTVGLGVLYGPLLGFVYALFASLLSASVAYALGRWFGSDVPPGAQGGLLQRLEAYPFETVLLCRTLALPGDLVNYVSGFLKVSYWAFLLATAIGGLPGLLVGVLAGASLGTTTARFTFDWGYLLASATLFVVSLGVSWWLRRASKSPLGESDPRL